MLFYSDIINDIASKNELSELQVKFLIENCGNNKQIIMENENSFIIDYLLHNFFSGKYKDIPMSFKLKLCNSLTNFILKNSTNDEKYYSKVSTYNTDKNSYAHFTNHLFNSKDCFINLNRNKIKKLIDNEDYVYLLETINHECVHALNHYSYEILKEVNTKNMILVKETIINFTNNKYYDDNYNVYLDEVIARSISYTYTKMYLEALGFKFVNNSNYEDKIKKEKEKLHCDERKLNGETVTVDEAFDKCVKEASWLSKYPILNIEYKNVNKKLERKSLDEIKNDYSRFQNGELSYNGKKEDIDELYQHIIKRQSLNSMMVNDSNSVIDSSIKK